VVCFIKSPFRIPQGDFFDGVPTFVKELNQKKNEDKLVKSQDILMKNGRIGLRLGDQL
jgi:hypothetical protein